MKRSAQSSKWKHNMCLNECLPTVRKPGFHAQLNCTGEMGFDKVPTGNWILEGNERWKEIKFSGVLRAVIVFKSWGLPVTTKKKKWKQKPLCLFFYRSVDVCPTLQCSGWSFGWKLLPGLPAVFRKRVLQGCNYKDVWPFISTQKP